MSDEIESVEWQHNDPKKQMHYVLSFMDDREHGLPVIGFESFSPFGPIAVGDFINTVGWKLEFEGHGLRVVRVSHQLTEMRDELMHYTMIYCRWNSEEAHSNAIP